MEVDEIIDSLLMDETPTTRDTTATRDIMKPSMADASFDGPAKPEPQAADGSSQSKCEQPAVLVAGGQAQQYLGKKFTVEQIDSLPKDEVRRLYMCYES